MDFRQNSIGNSLREARESRGLSLFEVYRETRIHSEILQALENDDYSPFASAAYAKSFLSQYATFLGVEAQNWLNAIGPCHYTHDPYEIDFLIAEQTAPAKNSKKIRSLTGKLFPTFLGFLISAALLYGVYRVDRIYNEKNKPAQAPPISAPEQPTPPRATIVIE